MPPQNQIDALRSGGPFSTDEQDNIRNDLQDDRTRLSSLDEQITALMRDRATAVEAITTPEALITPIRSLPDDILQRYLSTACRGIGTQP